MSIPEWGAPETSEFRLVPAENRKRNVFRRWLNARITLRIGARRADSEDEKEARWFKNQIERATPFWWLHHNPHTVEHADWS